MELFSSSCFKSREDPQVFRNSVHPIRVNVIASYLFGTTVKMESIHERSKLELNILRDSYKITSCAIEQLHV